MQGEYRGDFTCDTFHPKNRYLRVLYQQGRVQLDADHNEQVSILLHHLQSLAKDLYGPFGGPCDSGFLIAPTGAPDKDFKIGAGHYYVDGILCEVEEKEADGQDLVFTYLTQPDYPAPATLENNNTYLVYLDVWERHITYVEDDGIREVALGGPDTATRAKVVCQVKVENELPDGIASISKNNVIGDNWGKWVELWQPANRGQLKAKSKEVSHQETDPCITSPESRYRGAENQLYRVEIHTGGKAGDEATFKCSRENGSVAFPIQELEGNTVVLEHLGRDSRFGLAPGDWVEIVDDEYILRGRAEPLLQVDAIDPDTRKVTLKGIPASMVGQALEKHPLLRRWDHKAGKSTEGGLVLHDGAALIIEGETSSNWLELEDGVLVQFQPGGTYRTGDYWLIPARTATGDVEWPGDVGKPEALPPHGVEHHYGPLAIINVAPSGDVTLAVDDDGDLRSEKTLVDCEIATDTRVRARRPR